MCGVDDGLLLLAVVDKLEEEAGDEVKDDADND